MIKKKRKFFIDICVTQNSCFGAFLKDVFRPWDISIDLLDHQPDRNNIWNPLKIDYAVCVEDDEEVVEGGEDKNSRNSRRRKIRHYLSTIIQYQPTGRCKYKKSSFSCKELAAEITNKSHHNLKNGNAPSHLIVEFSS